MRKFSKINESIEDKDPIDPSEDVKEFKEKFSEFKPNNRASSELIDIESSYPTMTDEYDIYKVVELDEYGRELHYKGVKKPGYGYYRAVSRNHARIKASIANLRSDIFLTGFFDGIKVEYSDIKSEIKSLELKKQNIENELDNLKNPL